MNTTIKTINWLQCVFAPMPDASSVTIEVLVKAWSVYENKQTNWLSHFLEHMFFKGWKTYKTPKDVVVALDTLGAWFNAFTGDEYAGYYVKVAPQFTDTALLVLSDMLVHSQFPKQEIKTEKWVVTQEIMMYEDMPNRQIHDKWKNWYYGDTPYGRSILGPVENVQSFTQDDLFAHKQSLYTKDNCVIVVAGAIVDQDALEWRIAEFFGSLPEKTTWIFPEFTIQKPSTNESWYKKETQQNHLLIGAEGYTMYDDERYAASMLTTIFGGTMSSRLFQNIREKQWLCYYIGAWHYSGHTTWTFMIYGGMEKWRWDLWKQAIYDEVWMLFDRWITDEEFEQARMNIQWSIPMGLETSDEVANYVAKQVLYKGSVKTMNETLTNYMAVTKEEINACAKKLAQDSLYAYWIE